jgi:CubicO group peptidase (beta-lactamase class C family)
MIDHFRGIKKRCCALLLLGAHAGLAQSPASIQQQIDPLFGSVQKGTPGGIVLVAQGGKVLLEKGYGLANLATSAPITVSTRFRIGSITKQFTAAAILKLHEQGRLSLQDRLSKFIPDWPHGDEVTLHQLLNHTSGIHDYTHKPDFAENTKARIALEDLMRSFKNDPLDFAPGRKFLYDNSGYVLLKYIVEKVSGSTYEHYLRTTFFEPLAMKHTGIYPVEAVGPDDAVGYAFENGTTHPAQNWQPSWLAGSGEICSTAGDLFLWNEALFGGKVLSAAGLKTAFTVGIVEGDDPAHPEPTGYGCGWIIDTLRGEREIGHGGELAGFGGYLLRIPERSLTVVVLLNCVPQMPSLHQWNLARDIAARVLRLPPATAPKIYADGLPSDLEAIVGRYDMGNQMDMTVTVQDGHAFFEITGRPKIEFFPKSDRSFFVAGGGAEATFVRKADGKIGKAILKQGGARIDAPRLP